MLTAIGHTLHSKTATDALPKPAEATAAPSNEKPVTAAERTLPQSSQETPTPMHQILVTTTPPSSSSKVESTARQTASFSSAKQRPENKSHAPTSVKPANKESAMLIALRKKFATFTDFDMSSYKISEAFEVAKKIDAEMEREGIHTESCCILLVGKLQKSFIKSLESLDLGHQSFDINQSSLKEALKVVKNLNKQDRLDQSVIRLMALLVINDVGLDEAKQTLAKCNGQERGLTKKELRAIKILNFALDPTTKFKAIYSLDAERIIDEIEQTNSLEIMQKRFASLCRRATDELDRQAIDGCVFEKILEIADMINKKTEQEGRDSENSYFKLVATLNKKWTAYYKSEDVPKEISILLKKLSEYRPNDKVFSFLIYLVKKGVAHKEVKQALVEWEKSRYNFSNDEMLNILILEAGLVPEKARDYGFTYFETLIYLKDNIQEIQKNNCEYVIACTSVIKSLLRLQPKAQKIVLPFVMKIADNWNKERDRLIYNALATTFTELAEESTALKESLEVIKILSKVKPEYTIFNLMTTLAKQGFGIKELRRILTQFEQNKYRLDFLDISRKNELELALHQQEAASSQSQAEMQATLEMIREAPIKQAKSVFFLLSKSLESGVGVFEALEAAEILDKRMRSEDVESHSCYYSLASPFTKFAKQGKFLQPAIELAETLSCMAPQTESIQLIIELVNRDLCIDTAKRMIGRCEEQEVFTAKMDLEKAVEDAEYRQKNSQVKGFNLREGKRSVP